MITLNSQDSLHKAWLYRVLINIVDNQRLSALYFKGGTCAAMLGLLDRFSLDLDFDYVGPPDELPALRRELKKVFINLGLEIKDESAKVPQFFLKYPTKLKAERNTLKIDITYPPPLTNIYQPAKLTDIERVIICQDTATMFANKLVAVLDRYERNGSIAGRDIYDIHHFFLAGYRYNQAVIGERTSLSILDFFKKLKKFIEKKVSDLIISQDLNTLVPYERFRSLRKTLKTETLMLIEDEIKRLEDS